MSQSSAEKTIEEDDQTEAPLTMAASIVLTNLPRDASKALENAGNLLIEKSTCHDRRLFCILPLSMLISHSNRPSSAYRLCTSSQPEGFQAIDKPAL